MLKRLVNEAEIELRLTTAGPLLIKSGQPSQGDTDMEPVLTFRDGELQPFLPGSSIKGVFRSQAERILRLYRQEAACNPFGQPGPGVAAPDVFCGRRLEGHREPVRKSVPMPVAYAESCLACRLFGCTQFIGRFASRDAYLEAGQPAYSLEHRDGVGIDRITGGAAAQGRALFQFDVVPPGVTFTTALQLRNFEVWQLGLVLAVARDLCEGHLRLGMGRSRGLGAMEGTIERVTLTQFGRKPEGRLLGLGAALADGTYGTDPNDYLELAGEPDRRGLRWEWTVREQVPELLEAGLMMLEQFMQGWAPPKIASGGPNGRE